VNLVLFEREIAAGIESGRSARERRPDHGQKVSACSQNWEDDGVAVVLQLLCSGGREISRLGAKVSEELVKRQIVNTASSSRLHAF
jgi:asparagine synthetase A